MLDKWFIENVQQGLKNSNRFVIVDPANHCGFLIELLKQNQAWKVFTVRSEMDELKVNTRLKNSTWETPLLSIPPGAWKN